MGTKANTKANALGFKVQEHLESLGIECPIRKSISSASNERDVSRYVQSILQALNLDMRDDSLKDTPKRVARMYLEEVFYGLRYENFPKMTVVKNRMKYDEMITCRCQVMSLCEHHLVPFIGTAHIGYIPKDNVLGLSKFNRLVDFFSRRPQIQERLTEQVSAALQFILATEDVAVVISAEHLCVKLRGVKDQQSNTVTSKLAGRFRSTPEVRSEFLALTRK